MTNFLAFRHQYRNALAVARLQVVIAIHVDDFEVKTLPSLPLPQGGDHVEAEVAILPAVYNQHGRVRCRAFTCRHRRSFSW